uniref:Transposase Tc1-like domain-containing protein n=1 Tax=Lepeophtheirus salmonis TaxID=72036 RepID=A0A0K2TYE7_LEPSM
MRAFEAKPTVSIAKFAKKKKKSVASSTVSKAIKAVRGKSERYVEKPLTTQHQQDIRMEWAKRLLNNLKHHGNRVIFFSDEKTFTIYHVFNK